MSEYVLVHHGVKGMKWGVRRYQRKLNRESLKKAKKDFESETEKARAEYERDRKLAKGNKVAETAARDKYMKKTVSAQSKLDLAKAAVKDSEVYRHDKRVKKAVGVSLGVLGTAVVGTLAAGYAADKIMSGAKAELESWKDVFGYV